MQKKTKNDYDVVKNMLKTIRTITESKTPTRTLNEVAEFQSPSVDKAEENLKNDITVVNDVEVKLNSPDEADMTLQDSQKEAISQLIDNFKQQVSQIADFHPGITMTPDQVRFDGTLTDLDISFVFIAGKDAGAYINADMLKLEQEIANELEKLAKFQETFETAMEPLIQSRNNNI
jgi:predicted Holliday junction resolvase-like endonuclease